MYIWPSGGPGGAPRGRVAVEPQVRSEEDVMAIGNTNGAAADIGWGWVHFCKIRGGQISATKIGKAAYISKAT